MSDETSSDEEDETVSVSDLIRKLFTGNVKPPVLMDESDAGPSTD